MKDDDISIFTKEKKNESCKNNKTIEFLIDNMCKTYGGDGDKVLEWFDLAEKCIRNIDKNDKFNEHTDELKKKYDKFYQDFM